MLRIVLLSCLVAGGLSAKLPLGAKHRSLGHQSGGTSSFSSSSSSAGGSTGSNGNGNSYSGSTYRANGGNFRANGGAASFNGNGNGGVSFNANGGDSFGVNGGASFGGANNGQYDASANNGAQFDDGSYRPDEAEGQFDDGTWKPTLYSGDDGLYKDGEYAPNTDASYQFQFDVGDHGRDEAADREGQVQGSFYAVHPDGQRRDVEFSAGREGFVVTRDESSQGPVPEYALRQATKPRKVYPPAEIITSLSPDGIYHWEYDAGDSSRSEDIDLNTNYYEGNFDFVADDDQNRYEVTYKAGAGIGFVPEGDHLPMQVGETPEVANARAAFLEKFAEAEAEARQRPNAYRGNGFQKPQASNGNGFQKSQINNGNGFQRPKAYNGNGFQRQKANSGNGFQRPQANNDNGFQRAQTYSGNGFQGAQANNGNGVLRPQASNGNGFQNVQTYSGNGLRGAQASNGNGFQRPQASNGNGFRRAQAFDGSQEPFGAGSQTRYSSAAAPRRQQAGVAVHPSQMVSRLALGGHMKKAGAAADPASLSSTYLPPGN